MFDWLFEGRLLVYGLLGVVAFLLLLAWLRTRRQVWLVAVLAVALLALVYALLDRFVETDREQIPRKIRDMAAGVNANDLGRTFEDISDNFRTPGGKDKETFRQLAQGYLNSKTVEKVEVWDIVPTEISRQQNFAKASFNVKFKGGVLVSEGLFFVCEATFDRDAAHGWRMTGFRLFKPQPFEEMPLPF